MALTLEHVQDRSLSRVPQRGLKFDSQPVGDDSQWAVSSAASRVPQQQTDLCCRIFPSQPCMKARLEFLFMWLLLQLLRRHGGFEVCAYVCEVTSRSPICVAYSDISSAAGAIFWL